MFENQIKPRRDTIAAATLKDYAGACRTFRWDDLNPAFTWHETGRVNIAHEAIDRHAENPVLADTPCLVCDVPGRSASISFAEMRRLSNRLGNALRSLGVGRGDRVFLFLPSCPELYIAVAGCAKIGAIIAPLYSNYREGAVRDRMRDGRPVALVTTARLAGRVPRADLPDLRHVIIVGEEADAGTCSWQELMDAAADKLEPVWVDRADPLLLIYTSAHNNTPIGLLASHDAMRGYLMTGRWVLDLQPGDRLWTQAQPGWPLNVIYSAFAPWLCGVTSFVTGRIHSAGELYRFIQDHGITTVYTIARLYRMCVEAGEETARRYRLVSLRHLYSVLEPLVPETIYGVMRVLGLPVYDTWWSAETGMITIANLPCMTIKPGYLGRPVPGVRAAVVDSAGTPVPPFTMGELALQAPWPAMTTGVWGRPELYERYISTPPWFLSSDTAFVDQDGYFFYQGHADNIVITTAGKMGLAEIEATLLQHPAVAAAGVIRVPGPTGMKQIKAYIQPEAGVSADPARADAIKAFVLERLSPDVVPREICFCDSLPVDASGRILRRVLKAWELGLPTGDISRL